MTRILDVAVAVRRVRLLAIAFAAIQFTLFTPSPGAGPFPFARLPWFVAIAGVLLATNGLSWWGERRAPERTRSIALIETATDTLVVITVFVLFGFDPDVRLWPVLTFPILEGSLRAELRGSLAVWAAGSTAYAVEQLLRAPGRGEELALTIPSITFAAGILLFVAIGTGVSSRRLSEADARSRQERERLRLLADVARDLVDTDDTAVAAARLVEASSELTGYEYGSLMEHLGGERWSRRAAVGLADPRPDVEPRTLPDYTALAHRLDGPTEIDTASELGERLRVYAPDARTLVALPVSREGRLLGMLFLGSVRPDLVLDDEVGNLLILLSAHAAVAIDKARIAEHREATIAQLEHVDEVKDDFLAILTHELRSPMTAMAGYSELLLERWEQVSATQRQEFLGSISSNTRRLAQLIEDVFDALRAERTELPVVAQPVDLAPIVHDATRRHVDASGRHRLALDIEPDAPAAWADPDRVAQVVDNLVSNAVKYAPAGGTVEVAVRTRGDRVVVAVRDEGLGIPADDRDRLFGKFVRLHPDEGIGGTGLGLYLTRTLVEAMGGTIDVVSEEGVGSTFTVALPLVRTSGSGAELATAGERT